MKKILILRDVLPSSDHEIFLTDYLKKYFNNRALVETKLFTEAHLDFAPNKVKIFFGEKDASTYDLIWFRKTRRRYAFLAAALALGLEFNGIKYFDTSFGRRAVGGNKLINLLRLAVAGLPIPRTIFGFKTEVEKKKASLIENFGFPMVAKVMDVHWGAGVFVLRNKEEFDQFFHSRGERKQLLFQKFYPHKGDYRILVLGYKSGSWEIMYRKADLKPGSVGGSVPVGELQKKEFFPINELPPEMEKLAVKAARAVNLEIAGVDIFVDSKTGEYLMTEVNRTPGFAIDYPGDPELKAVASFLEKSVGL